MKILIETIPHSAQRYPTVGDWQWTVHHKVTCCLYPSPYDEREPTGKCNCGATPTDELVIRVSQLSDWRYEALVGIHEAIEALLCKHTGVTEQMVDDFDLNYKGKDPGEDSAAPYQLQHLAATTVEKILADKLDVAWSKYCEEVDALP